MQKPLWRVTASLWLCCAASFTTCCSSDSSIVFITLVSHWYHISVTLVLHWYYIGITLSRKTTWSVVEFSAVAMNLLSPTHENGKWHTGLCSMFGHEMLVGQQNQHLPQQKAVVNQEQQIQPFHLVALWSGFPRASQCFPALFVDAGHFLSIWGLDIFSVFPCFCKSSAVFVVLLSNTLFKKTNLSCINDSVQSWFGGFVFV